MKFLNLRNLTLLSIFLAYIVILVFGPEEPLNPKSHKFIGQVSQVSFVFIFEFFAIFLTIRNINWKKNIKLEHILWELIGTSVFMMMFPSQLITGWTQILNYPFRQLFPERIVNVIMGQNKQQMWPLFVIFINIVIMYIKFLFQSKANKIKKISLYSLLLNSLIVYGTLVILLWIQSHFSYVDAFFSHMTTETRVVESLVHMHKDDPNYLKTKNIQYLLSEEEVIKNIEEKIKDEGANVKNTVNQYFKDPVNIFLGKENNKFKFDAWKEMRSFEDWVAFLNNTNNRYITHNKIILTKFIFPEKKLEKREYIRQGILYIEEYNGGYYYYFNLSSEFQKNKMHYMYSYSYLVFNILMIISLIYLYKYHKKKVFKNENKEI